jgi:hypothetical protein
MADRRLAIAAVCFLAASATAAFAASAAAPPPTADRAAITRGLRSLAVGGDWWIEKKACASCHHVPFLLWSHNEAVRAGLPVDRKQLAAWTSWTLAAMLASDGGGVDTMAQVILGRDRSSAWRRKPPLHGKTTDPYEHLWRYLLRDQTPDGHWDPGGQLTCPPEVTTAWVLLALDSREPSDPSAPPSELGPGLAEAVRHIQARLPTAQEQARQWLAAQGPAPTTEALMLRMLLASRAADPRWRDLLTSIRSRQCPDGGWASRNGAAASDPLTTGQVLWALGEAGLPPSEPAAAKARTYLLRTQQPDGSWITPTAAIHDVTAARAVRTDPIYRYWGTAWATLGLLRVLPPTLKKGGANGQMRLSLRAGAAGGDGRLRPQPPHAKKAAAR